MTPHDQSRMHRALGTAGLCMVVQLAAAPPAVARDQQAAPEQSVESSAPNPPARRFFTFSLDERPSFKFGDVLRLDVTTKLDADVRQSTDLEPEGGTFAFGNSRIGLEGRLFGAIGFEIERELQDDSQPWRDVFVEFRQWRALRVRAGRFKLPFGRERVTPVSQLDFIHRSLASQALTPGRDSGVEAHGRVLGDVLSYRAGVFRHDGDVARDGTESPGSRTFAGGVTIVPFARAGVAALEDLEIGTATTIGDVPGGLNGLRSRTVGGYEALAPLYVAGRRVRLAVDTSWARGPVALRGEFLRVRDERLGQSLGNQDLPDVFGTGWYVGGTWTVVGALKANGMAPRRGLERGGVGAIQLAARTEGLGFASDPSADAPFRNPRAANVMPNDIRAQTLGVNWFPVRFVKLQFNVVREHLDDPERRPDPARAFVFSRFVRIQFAW